MRPAFYGQPGTFVDEAPDGAMTVSRGLRALFTPAAAADAPDASGALELLPLPQPRARRAADIRHSMPVSGVAELNTYTYALPLYLLRAITLIRRHRLITDT